MNDPKVVETCVTLLESASDVAGIHNAMKPLCDALRNHAEFSEIRGNRKVIFSVIEAGAKALKALNSLGEKTDDNEKAAIVDSVFGVWDLVFDGAVKTLLEWNDVTAKENWMPRAFMLKDLGTNLTPSRKAVEAAPQCAPKVTERLSKFYDLLFSVVIEGVSTEGPGSAATSNRNIQEVRLAADAIVASAYTCPACSAPALTEVVTGYLKERGPQVQKTAMSALQQVVGAVIAKRDAGNREAAVHILGGLHAAVASLVLPSDWTAPLDQTAWATAATMASQVMTHQAPHGSASHAGAEHMPASWANALIERFLHDAASYLREATENVSTSNTNADAAAAAAAPAPAASKKAAPKPAAKKPAAKKPGGKGRGKKAAKVEEEEEESSAPTPVPVQADDDAATATSKCDDAAADGVEVAKKRVLARAISLLDTCVEADIKHLRLATLCRFAELIFDLVGELDAEKSSDEDKAQHLHLWRSIATLARSSGHHNVDAESQQKFVNKICVGAMRYAAAHSVLLLEALSTVLVQFSSQSVRVASKEEIAPAASSSSEGEPTSPGASGRPSASSAGGGIALRDLRQVSQAMMLAGNQLDSRASATIRALNLLRRNQPTTQQKDNNNDAAETKNNGENNNNRGESPEANTAVQASVDVCLESLKKLKEREALCKAISLVLGRIIEHAQHQKLLSAGTLPMPSWLKQHHVHRRN